MRVGALPRPGRRRLAQQPAPAARGVGDVGHEGGPERRPERQRPRRLVGRGLRRATTAGPSAVARRTPTRPPRTGPTRRTCTGCSRRRSSPRYYERDATGLPQRWLDGHAPRDGERAVALLDDADAPRVHRAAVPAGGRRAEPSTAARRSRGRDRSRLTAPPMAPRISLALALHNHQPVGNFGWVFAEVFEQAYEPMVEALERHPDVRLSLHYTGPAARVAARRAARVHRPRCAALVARGQVEILGGGYYEPVLASLPERDRIGQLSRMARRARGAVRAAAARRLAGRARLGAGPADLARRGRLRLDDPRRRPLPRRGDPRGGALGPVHDRRPGPAAARLRHRAGPALPDPVPRRRGGHRLPARPRHRGRRAGRDDGRRRREVRGVADDLGALLGQAAAGSTASSRRSRRTPTG